jgi:chromosome segregation ATPase
MNQYGQALSDNSGSIESIKKYIKDAIATLTPLRETRKNKFDMEHSLERLEERLGKLQMKTVEQQEQIDQLRLELATKTDMTSYEELKKIVQGLPTPEQVKEVIEPVEKMLEANEKKQKFYTKQFMAHMDVLKGYDEVLLNKASKW